MPGDVTQSVMRRLALCVEARKAPNNFPSISLVGRLSLVQAQFNALAATLGGENAHFAFSYDESLSHIIYAGCDIICVPSMFEPCGLTQVLHSSLHHPDTL